MDECERDEKIAYTVIISLCILYNDYKKLSICLSCNDFAQINSEISPIHFDHFQYKNVLNPFLVLYYSQIPFTCGIKLT